MDLLLFINAVFITTWEVVHIRDKMFTKELINQANTGKQEKLSKDNTNHSTCSQQKLKYHSILYISMFWKILEDKGVRT